jgi:hypothetical protein
MLKPFQYLNQTAIDFQSESLVFRLLASEMKGRDV